MQTHPNTFFSPDGPLKSVRSLNSFLNVSMKSLSCQRLHGHAIFENIKIIFFYLYDQFFYSFSTRFSRISLRNFFFAISFFACFYGAHVEFFDKKCQQSRDTVPLSKKDGNKKS